jgi:hypothetical protein
VSTSFFAMLNLLVQSFVADSLATPRTREQPTYAPSLLPTRENTNLALAWGQKIDYEVG